MVATGPEAFGIADARVWRSDVSLTRQPVWYWTFRLTKMFVWYGDIWCKEKRSFVEAATSRR